MPARRSRRRIPGFGIAGSRPVPAAGLWRAGSAAQPQAVDQRLVALGVDALQVIERRTPLADHDQQAAAGMEVLSMGRQMLGELLDAFAQNRDLDFGRSGVALFARV